jgi:hypothetical protein
MQSTTVRGVYGTVIVAEVRALLDPVVGVVVFVHR